MDVLAGEQEQAVALSPRTDGSVGTLPADMSSWIAGDRLEVRRVAVDQPRISVKRLALLPGDQVAGCAGRTSEVADKPGSIDSLATTSAIVGVQDGVLLEVVEGDAVTGVTIMQLDEGMDSGPILSQRETPIGPDETTMELTMRLFKMGAALLLEVLPRWERGEIRARPQDQSEATVTGRLTKGDGEVDWGRSAVYIARHVRAYHPWPGSFTHWRGRLLRITEASVSEAESPASPGSVVGLLKGRVGICSGEGVLEVRQVQLEGRRAVDVGDFLVGHRDFLGSEVGAKV